MRLFIDPQGNWQLYAGWQDEVVAAEPDVFKFVDVDAEPSPGTLYKDGKFVIPPPDLEAVKSAKIAELKRIRDTKELEPVIYDGSSFDFDSKSYERITAAIYALESQGAPATINWTLADNGSTPVTAANLRGVIAAAAVRSDALHTKYRELKAMVMAAKTAEEVEKITWAEA